MTLAEVCQLKRADEQVRARTLPAGGPDGWAVRVHGRSCPCGKPLNKTAKGKLCRRCWEAKGGRA
jgi:hypothetical protein